MNNSFSFSDENDFQNWLIKLCGSESFKPGLERIKKFLSHEIKILNQKKIITIAGTNGKGQTSQLIHSYLCQEYSCLYWSSPHIKSVTERINYNLENISFVNLSQLAMRVYDRMLSDEVRLSYYEFLFACFCFHAVEVNCDFLILEVGLGGRLDAVNILDAQLVCLTSISRDHCEYLGNRYNLILAEKLGVLRINSKLISCLQLKYLRESTEKIISGLNIEWHDLMEQGFSTGEIHYDQQNRLLAAMCCKQILPSSNLEEIKLKMQDYKDYRRITLVSGEKRVEFFGSHNLDGARKLIQFLQFKSYTNTNDLVVLAFSQRPLWEIKSMIKLANRSFPNSEIFMTSFNHAKALKINHDILEFLKGHIEYFEDWHKKIKSNPGTKNILFFGSYYFIHDAQQFFIDQGFCPDK